MAWDLLLCPLPKEENNWVNLTHLMSLSALVPKNTHIEESNYQNIHFSYHFFSILMEEIAFFPLKREILMGKMKSSMIEIESLFFLSVLVILDI